MGAGAGAGVGVGNTEPESAGAAAAGAAAVFGGFGFLGLRAGFGGGPAGLSSLTTGFGSMLVDAGVEKSPGTLTTCTWTVAGRNLSLVKVTENPASAAATATEQGVVQPGPSEVLASAPDGTEFELELHGGRRRLEGIQRKRRAAGETCPRHGNYEKTTHYRPITLRLSATTPARTIGASVQGRNRAESGR